MKNLVPYIPCVAFVAVAVGFWTVDSFVAVMALTAALLTLISAPRDNKPQAPTPSTTEVESDLPLTGHATPAGGSALSAIPSTGQPAEETAVGEPPFSR